MRARAFSEAQVEAQQLLEITLAALDVDAGLVPDAERMRIDAAIAVIREALAGDDVAALRGASDALNHATAALAGRRMDRDVKRALAGKRIDSLVADDHG
jgi:molecular chaperone HscA